MINMPWSFTIFLLFTCYFLDCWNWVSLGQGSYPKASLQVSPGSAIPRGGNLTFRCAGPYQNMRFVLYKGENISLYLDPPGAEAEFLIADVTQEAEGTYTCRYHSKAKPVTYSEPSDPVQIRVPDLPKPIISWEAVPDVRGDFRITCSAPEDQKAKRFLLYSDGVLAPLTDRSPPPGQHHVMFPCSSVTDRTVQRYRCSYQIQESGEHVSSLLSDPTYTGGDYQSTTRGNYQSTQTRRGSMPSGKNETSDKKDNTSTTIIISVVCAALLVIVLIIATAFYCKWKGKKARGDIQKSTLTVSEEAPATAVEPMYATVAGGKEDDSIIVPDVEQQTKGEDSEGLTYATINKEALKKKKKKTAAPSSYEPESTLYAAVNVH